MDRLSCPLVALHIPHHCPYCQTRHHDHDQLKDNDLYPSTSSQARFKSRQRQRRVATLAHDRATYHAELSHSQYNATHLIDRINNAAADLVRADVQVTQVDHGTYNTEMEFLTKRQRADVIRDSHLFRTSSVHEFGQELTLEQAKPILTYEIEHATALAEKNQTTLTFLTTQHPLVLHSCSRLVHWWAVRLRMKKGRLALRLLAAQLQASFFSEQQLLKKWLCRRMATRIQNCYRCHRARLRLQRLKHERKQRMGKRILTFLRLVLFQKKKKLLQVLWNRLCHCGRMQLLEGLNRWSYVVYRCQRREWLVRFKRKWRLHFHALKIQIKFRYMSNLGRYSLANRVVQKLHRYVAKELNQCTAQNTRAMFSGIVQTTQNCTTAIVLNQWTFVKIVKTLEEMQTSTANEFEKASILFRFRRPETKGMVGTNGKGGNDLLSLENIYNTFDKGVQPIPFHYTSRYRGIGRPLSEPRPPQPLEPLETSAPRPQPKTAVPSYFTLKYRGCARPRQPPPSLPPLPRKISRRRGGGESYEWLLLQSVDRRYRCCKFILDYITSKFNQKGHELDLKDHRRLLRDFLRSLDITKLHDITKTTLRMKTYYFSWYWVNVALCNRCYAMWRTESTSVKCTVCGQHRYQRNKTNMTYSQLLTQQTNDAPMATEGSPHRFTTTFGNTIQPLPLPPLPLPLPLPRMKQRPKSLSDIQVAVLPFLIHAHYWAISPARYGSGLVGQHNVDELKGHEIDRGRNDEKRYRYWNQSVKETLMWSQLLIHKYGVETIEQLALWSVQRLVKVGRVPSNTASKICLLLALLGREIKKWAYTNGESLVLLKKKKRLIPVLIPGSSVCSVPEEYK